MVIKMMLVMVIVITAKQHQQKCGDVGSSSSSSSSSSRLSGNGWDSRASGGKIELVVDHPFHGEVNLAFQRHFVSHLPWVPRAVGRKTVTRQQ